MLMYLIHFASLYGHIFDDTVITLRSGIDEKKHLRVSFLGEPAMDGRGPRGEF